MSGTLLEKIEASRTVGTTPRTERLLPYTSIADLLDQWVDRQENAPYLIYYPDEGARKEYSYLEFRDEVSQAAGLLAASGVAKGDRVAVMSDNHADTVVQYFAAWMLGAVVVPVNANEDDRRIAYVVQNSGARLALVRDVYLERMTTLLRDIPGVRMVFQVGGKARADLPHYQTELARQSPRFRPQGGAGLDDEALIVYTSGTTGNPKGVVLDQYNLLVDAMAITEWHQVSHDQRMMCVLPLHHVNGIVVTLVTPMYAGASVVVNQKFHANRFFERMSTEKVSIVSVVPTLLQFLLHSTIDMEAYKLQHFRHFICGAGPLTVELATRFEQKFKMPIIHGYGLSETTCYSSFLPLDLSPAEHRHWMSKHGFPSIGVPLPVNDMAIHDDQGNEVQEGGRGEIVIRGHSVMKHYHEEAEANEQAFEHGWFRSGDEGFCKTDDQGRTFFFITGRMKEIIIRGGVNISPFEIDEVLGHIPGVQAAIAVGFANDWYGEEVGAYVTLKEGIQLTEADILTHCRKYLPFSKSPKVVVFGNDLPVTSTGKYQRSRCEELFAEWKTVQFAEPA